MTSKILPLGPGMSGNTVSPVLEERNLRNDLFNHLGSLIEEIGLTNLESTERYGETVEGVLHLEKHGILWREAVFHHRHIAGMECLAGVLTLSFENRFALNRESIREKLKIPPGVEENRLGLAIRTLGSASPLRTYLWVQAGLFMLKREYESKLEADRLAKKMAFFA